MNEPGYGYDWVLQINDQFKNMISTSNRSPLINYESLGKEATQAIPTPDRYLPLIYTLGLKGDKDGIAFLTTRLSNSRNFTVN